MDAALAEKIDALPTSPGVYLMKDRGGVVIYVGKAVNLRARVRSYFSRTGDERAFVPLLDDLLGDLETVLTRNEKEALLLENELIKKHHPRFNVLLRDDKNFICLRLDTRQRYPRLEVVRRFKGDGARYFGPFHSAGAIRETLRVINRWFHLRTCSDHVLATRKRPCILFQIGRCPAPCVAPVPIEAYGQSVEEVVLFLEGRGGELLEHLRTRIRDAADRLAFEEAARLRDQLFAIERSLEPQGVAGADLGNRDVLGFFRQADRLVIYVLFVRQGRVSGGLPFSFTGQEFPDPELLSSFVNLFYAEEGSIPDEVLLPFAPGGLEALGELLSDRRGAAVRVAVPRRGRKRELVEMATRNAEAALHEKKRTAEETEAILSRLKDRLFLTRLPRRMECFDISHFQGSAVVASGVASENGELDKARYRRFRVRGRDGQAPSNDDFANMYEVVLRRVRRGLAAKDLPELLVIDGGKGQLASAVAACRDAGVEGLDVVALAKSREVGEAPTDGAAKVTPERVFVPGRKEPIVLPPSSPELFWLTRLRDEAHRFAITFQQRLARRTQLGSRLDEIAGVGQARRKSLLRHFGSVQRVREASVDQLTEVEGIGRSVARRIFDALRAEDAENEA